MRSVTKWTLLGLFMALLALWGTEASAYPRYSGDPSGGCVDCHGEFNDATSPQGNTFPDGTKHNMHRYDMANSNCNLCHSSGPKKGNVWMGSSVGTTANPIGYGCMGCHGRLEDAGNDSGSAASPGYGAGLRQHHTNAGETICTGCHSDADPANYTPVDENVLPPYYGTSDVVCDDPMNLVATFQVGENFTVGDFIGLDNDGDLLYDGADVSNISPTADAGPAQSGDVGDSIAFDGSLSDDPDGDNGLITYDWDYGDGNSDLDAGPTPSHIYLTSNGGTPWTVTLTITDEGGAQDSDTTTASINAGPVADAGGPYAGDVGEVIVFDGSASTDDVGISTYDWDFGDGTVVFDAGSAPTHTYATHVGSPFSVTVTVTDGGTLTDVAITTADINALPVADLSAGAPYTFTIDQSITFDASASSDADGTIDFYDWDYGDGNTALDAGPTPSHTYTSAGPFTVTLTVTDDLGATDQTSLVPGSNIAPIADPGGPYPITGGVPFDLTSGSTDSDGTIVAWFWEFGDSNTSTLENPTHTYASDGLYNVTLTVTDDDGGTDSASTTASTGVIAAAPPVLQNIGMDDSAFTAVTENDCRVCHDTGLPDRHHNLVGQTIPGGSQVPYPDSDGDGNDDTVYGCLNCHGVIFNVERDCTVCHTGSAHHSTAAALSRDCVACHGDLVDNYDDGHYIPSYSPSLVTPYRSVGTGDPANARGDKAGACDYCHNDDGLPTPVILTNEENHHNTGLDTGNCLWCHNDAGGPIGADDGSQMRICEGCHGPEALHNIQADSPNPANVGTIVVGQEDQGYGHVGRDAGPGSSDCWGCHGFGFAAVAPYAGPVIPTIYGADVTNMTAGTDTVVTLIGSGFVNITGATLYESNVLLTGANGYTVTLTPDAIDELAIIFTIPGTTPAGNYNVQAVKTDDAGNPVVSNPVVISIRPEVVIDDAACDGETVTINGRGFSQYVAGSPTRVTTLVKGKKKTTEVEQANIVFWSDTIIEAQFEFCPEEVTVESVFGSATSGVVQPPKPGNGKGRDK